MSSKRRNIDKENKNGAKRRKPKDQKRKSGEIGIIESLSVCNFMCHDNLEFEFGPNINFIIGQNGSGKSAILTAIILALGGRSSVTGRYPNIKGFVKTGKQRAKIELVLKNGGKHPYKPESYGSKVAIVREINIDGVSAYKLKSSAGKIISTSKEELKNILSAMDIQIENPVSALTQETSRSFLTACKPDKLYQFFYQGSGLEKLEKSYYDIRLMKDDTVAELRKKKELLPTMEEELKQWKKILKTAERIFDYKQELIWAQVIEMERQTMVKEEELTKAQQDLAKHKQEHDTLKDKLSSATSNRSELDTRKNECYERMGQYRDKMKELSTEYEKYSTECLKLEGKLNSFKRDEQRIANDISSVKSNINEILTKSQSDLNEDKMNREIELNRLKDELERLDQEKAQLEKDQKDKREKEHELKADRDTIPSEIGRCEFWLQKQEEDLERLKSSIQNRVNVFGNRTQNILNDIQRQRSQFSKLPKGPIGAYLEVKDPRWGPAVETCIKPNLLRAFCCDNTNDSLVLTEILKKYYQRLPTVLISKYASSMYDISRYKVACEFPTVFNMLTISDHVIANALIDNTRIESQILIEDTNIAINVMTEPPTNCFRAILMDCSTVELNPLRMYSSENRSQGCLLSSVGTGEIEKLEQNIAATKENIANLKKKLDVFRQQINQIKAESRNLEHLYVNCTPKINSTSRKIQELQIAEEPKSKHDMQDDLDQLENDLEKIKNEKQKYTSDYEESSAKRGDLHKEIETLSEKLKEENKQYIDLLENVSNCTQENESFAILIKKCAADIKELEDKLEPLKKEVEKNLKDVETAVSTAEDVCPRINTTRSVEELSRLVSETEKVVERESQCSREDLQKKYQEKKEQLQNAKGKLLEKENNIKYIDKMYKLRQEGFKDISFRTQSCINLAFITYLKDDYHANAIFDIKARSLTLEVRPNKSGTKFKHRGGKCISLSGGERSYVTIAFLLAMWDRIRTPFKILDEYDVFMDSNNRKLSIDLLIFQAKQMLETQFIFLSPLDLPPMEESSLIRIHQMPPPQRAEPAST